MFGSFAVQADDLAFGTLLFEVCGATVYVILTFGEQPVYQAGQVPGHRFDRFLAFLSPPQPPVSGPQGECPIDRRK